MSHEWDSGSDEDDDDVQSLITQMRNLRFNNYNNSNRQRRRNSNDDWETRTVTSSINALQVGNGRRNVSLERLNRQLETLHESMGISLTKMRKIIKNKGICLKNCVEYGSRQALQRKLRSNPRLTLSRNKAKRYKYVKSCLIVVDS